MQPSSPGKRRRPPDGRQEALRRLRELGEVAAENAPEASYLDRPRESAASAQPMLLRSSATSDSRARRRKKFLDFSRRTSWSQNIQGALSAEANCL